MTTLPMTVTMMMENNDEDKDNDDDKDGTKDDDAASDKLAEMLPHPYSQQQR